MKFTDFLAYFLVLQFYTAFVNAGIGWIAKESTLNALTTKIENGFLKLESKLLDLETMFGERNEMPEAKRAEVFKGKAITNQPNFFQRPAQFNTNSYLETNLTNLPRENEWIIIQRRGIDHNKRRISFEKSFKEYEDGFGDYDGDFWIGLEKIHNLTSSGYALLKIVLTDWNGMQTFAEYGNFSIEGKNERYQLKIGKYSGTAGDSLTFANGQQFSTFDRDNDALLDGNCAVDYGGGGGWWFTRCGWNNLNGIYQRREAIRSSDGIGTIGEGHILTKQAK